MGVVALFLLVFFSFDEASYLFPLRHLDITPWNPLAGLSVFIILRYGNIYAVLICTARIISDILVRREPGSLLVILLGAIIIVAGYVLTAIILRKVADLRVDTPTLNAVGTFSVAVLIVTALTSLAYVLLVFAFGALDRAILLESWLRRFVGDVSGIITVLPALLTFRPLFDSLSWRSIRPAPIHIAQALVLLLIVAVLFGVEPIDEAKFFYVLFLPIIWIAVQGGFTAAAGGVLWTQVVLIAAMEFIATYYTGAGVTEIEILMITLAVTGLMLGTVVSERRSAELQLVETRAELNDVGRRAASGELASVIAHELNQPLTAVVYYARSAQLMWQRRGDSTLLDETLSKASTQANRAAEIVGRLRNFIGHGVQSPTVFSVNDLVAEVIKLAAPTTKAEDIVIRTALAADFDRVYADRVQIFQVLDNLVRNALDAVVAGGKRPRIVTVASANDEGGEVLVRVADTGSGIPADLADRIFQPFVTTKKLGMGLGLTICRTIITAHEGQLWYEPADEGGAAFMFTLPAHLEPHDIDS